MTGEVLVVAGETSGDLHAAGVVAELRSLVPGLKVTGIGGERMHDAGATLLERSDRLAVMGFVEVLRHLPRHWALLRRLRRMLRQGHFKLVILIDYPGFNMKLAQAAHDAGVPVLYYITPQVWAWGSGRIARLAEIVTRAAVILPFEEELLTSEGVPATFVGHPLLDRAGALPDRASARARIGVPSDAPLLALFPGSRVQEVDRLLDAFVAAARLLERRIPGLTTVVSVAPGMAVDPARCPYPLVRSDSFAVLRAADAALCKSGTTTLEAAVAGCPLAVAYRTSGWSYAIARRLVKIEHIGLVNIVAGRQVAPELVQDAGSPVALANAMEPLLDHNSVERLAQIEGLAEVREKLGKPGAARRVAEMAVELIQ